MKLLRNTSLLFMVLLFLIVGLDTTAQSCGNIDFSDGNFNNWTGRATTDHGHPGSGTYNATGTPPLTGYPNRHVLFNDPVPVTDPNACDNISRTPPGKTRSMRLGNDNTGCEIDEVSYNITVGADNNLLLFDYAVVLEDPQNQPHPPEVKPRFIFRLIQTATGLPIDPVCGEYNVYADSTVEGFRECGNVRYRAWTTVGVDLRNFEALPPPMNEVTIFFRTEDCGFHGHFGYAYINAECKKLEIESNYCQGSNTATLTAPPGFSYLWENGESTQTLLIRNPIPYQTVKVKLISLMGCSYDLETQLIPQTVTANFTSSNDTICIGDSISFEDLSFGASQENGTIIYADITKRLWKFGDGDTSSLAKPSHLFNSTGAYIVHLQVETEKGCKASVSKIIVVNEAPIANFFATDVCAGEHAKFTNRSYINFGTITNYHWDFNDLGSAQNNSIIENPSHQYIAPGDYDVTLEITSNQGCKNKFSKKVSIHFIPTPDFTFDLGCVNNATQFYDASSIFNGAITAWSWDFGILGNNSSQQDPTYRFPIAQTYNVSLTAFSNYGCKKTVVKPIQIIDADIDFPVAPICQGNDAVFQGSSLQNIIQWDWDYGDGNTGSGQSVIHQYQSIGTFTVTITGTADIGCRVSKSKEIQIQPRPLTKFRSLDKEGCEVFCTDFRDETQSVDSINYWEWHFGDNAISYDRHPSHCYEKPGTYSVKLITITDKQCKDTNYIPDMIRVYSQPTANFNFDESDLDIAYTKVLFQNKSYNATDYSWGFDDLGTSSEEHPFFLFPPTPNSTYKICLEALQSEFCSDRICKDIKIHGHLLYIPNSFTPNDDDINDHFKPIIKGFSDRNYSFAIYNRWGQLIFETHNPGEGWNGKFKDKLVREGVYVWKIKGTVKEQNGSNLPKELYGHVTILLKTASNNN